MLQQLKATGKWHISILLGSMVLFCFSLIFFRVFYTGSIFFAFLLWNLFLACIPYWISTVAIYFVERKKILLLLLPLWLLFLPNAPYIITDLMHLKYSITMPLWYDVLLLFTCAFTGLMLFYYSLRDAQQLLRIYFSGRMTYIFISAIIFLSAFGIYIGRYLRWNSWDIITDPYILFADIFSRIADPASHPRTCGMTLILFLFLSLGYSIFSHFNNKEKRSA